MQWAVLAMHAACRSEPRHTDGDCLMWLLKKAQLWCAGLLCDLQVCSGFDTGVNMQPADACDICQCIGECDMRCDGVPKMYWPEEVTANRHDVAVGLAAQSQCNEG